ncbi:MAG: ribose-phosphate pyrophosphokinase [Candidatus Levybacteria bacterium]|nr:ribose-phosphate pyrophosphokinase [Candidatus Levybacteria bacterium]MBI3070439.1 ribose-phosphate pyrophosphokinase [Candidatus Levybacteria bacterium]
MKVFSGSSNKPLAEKIAEKLKTKLSPLEIHIFPDGEKRVRILEKVVDNECVVVQSTSTPTDQNYMELFFIVDAIRRSGAKSATAVIPYLGYQRQDHIFREGEAVSLEVVIRTLEAVGMDKLILFDLHSIKIPELFHIPVCHLSALPLFAEKIKEERFTNNSTVLISPDMGGIRRIKMLSEMLSGMPYASIVKNRNLATGETTAEEIEGEVKKRALIVDDMISSGSTIITAVNLLLQKGVSEIYVFATHPVFSNAAPQVLQKSAIKKVFVTDSIEVPEKKQFPKLEVLSIAKMIADELKKKR